MAVSRQIFRLMHTFKPLALLILATLCLTQSPAPAAEAGRWPEKKAQAWGKKTGWLVGCNFTPSTAINQLEMWQADTFDEVTIDRELGWAEDLGFNSMRVFLHHLPYQEDPKGYLKRIEKFLKIADRHHIGITFALLDSCWDPFPKAGLQRAPAPHVHNSGWVQSPGKEILSNPARHDEMQPYVYGIIRHFRNDRRIHAWDIFNEPDNMNNAYAKQEFKEKPAMALLLIQKAFGWAREAKPSQPLTSGVWLTTWANPAKLSAMEKFCLEESDVISFHNYGKPEQMSECIKNLQRYHRPILCTEYMARPQGSTFDPQLGLMKDQMVGAYNWGFVDGKTQTIYPWDSWTKKYTDEPPVWFHDILRRDGTAYRAAEAAYIKSVTADKKRK